jgi:hypothetical protein
MSAARLVRSGVAWGAGLSLAAALVILVPLGGREYYRTPLAVRGYAAAHPLLRPSGPVGQTLGIAGALFMLMPFLYMARKRASRWFAAGSLKTWLEVHLLCGIAGPVLITFHTSFKFNGIVSAAYWSMVMVVLSGFVGRYLYVRIPRSIRGTELTRAELDARAEAVRADLAASVPAALLARIDQFDPAPSDGRARLLDFLVGEIVLARRLRAFDRELQRSGLPIALRAEIHRLLADRSVLMRRIAHLQRTKKLFELWHVFHMPLVHVMWVIVAVHVAITLYMGYVPFRW